MTTTAAEPATYHRAQLSQMARRQAAVADNENTAADTRIGAAHRYAAIMWLLHGLDGDHRPDLHHTSCLRAWSNRLNSVPRINSEKHRQTIVRQIRALDWGLDTIEETE